MLISFRSFNPDKSFQFIAEVSSIIFLLSFLKPLNSYFCRIPWSSLWPSHFLTFISYNSIIFFSTISIYIITINMYDLNIDLLRWSKPMHRDCKKCQRNELLFWFYINRLRTDMINTTIYIFKDYWSVG